MSSDAHDPSLSSSHNTPPAAAPAADKVAMVSNTSSVAVSDPHAKYPSLQFTEDEVHVLKPWGPEDTEVFEMAKNLTPIQVAWLVSREKAIEDLLWEKFVNRIEERGLYEDWADNAIIPQVQDKHTPVERDDMQIAWLEAKAPDLLDEFKEHRKGQRARLAIRERPGWVPT